MFVRSVLVVFFTLLLGSASITTAQEVQQSIDISIQSVPLDPKPGETISLEAISYGVDLSQTSLTWTYGGRTIDSGFGKTRVVVLAPQSGAVATATVTASASGISPLSASITFRPGSVDLLWEGADSLTPPFYKGRALVAPGGIFRVVAIPASSAPRQVSFLWSRNDGAVTEASGMGRSELLLQNTAFERQEKIGVSISGGNFEGGTTTTILPRTPSIVAYQKRNGFVNYALGSTDSINSKTSGLVALFEPFFFSSSTGTPLGLSFAVQDGEELLYGDSLPNEIRFSKSDTTTEGVVSVSVSPSGYTLQNIKKNFSILFE